MKYLLNLPLALAALLQVWFASLVFMSAPWSGWSDGPSRGAMVKSGTEPPPRGTPMRMRTGKRRSASKIMKPELAAITMFHCSAA